MENRLQAERDAGPADRWILIRDIAVLQVKLVVDGLRDFILVPISLLAGLFSLVTSESIADSAFYRLLRLGRRSERWINLFAAVNRLPDADADTDRFPNEDIDAMVSRVETFVIDEYRKGGLTRQAKERLDQAINSLHKIASGEKSRAPSDDAGEN